MFKELDPLLHSECRLAIISLLAGVESADFPYIRTKTGTTSGNLSIQIHKLQKAGYISISKGYKGNMPQTTCRITQEGLIALDNYVNVLRTYLPTL